MLAKNPPWLCGLRARLYVEPSPAPLDMGSAAACAQIIEVHLAFDFFLEREGFFPVNLGFLGEHDRSDERIGAVGGFNPAGSQVRLALEPLAALLSYRFRRLVSWAMSFSSLGMIICRRSRSWPTVDHHSAERLA